MNTVIQLFKDKNVICEIDGKSDEEKVRESLKLVEDAFTHYPEKSRAFFEEISQKAKSNYQESLKEENQIASMDRDFSNSK